jgi:hypothetical protein
MYRSGKKYIPYNNLDAGFSTADVEQTNIHGHAYGLLQP